MARRLFTLLSALSLLLCVASLLLVQVGFGLGDTWVINPINPGGWLFLPLGFGAASFVFFVTAYRKVWQRQTRMSLGLCHACGYDLRATAGRCPECGTAPAAKQV